MPERIDSASRLINASPNEVYAALMSAEALVQWLPPKGMSGEIYAFEPREGGVFRMALTYNETAGRGKTSADTDVVESRFRKLVPNVQVVSVATFQSDDPAYGGEMEMTWDLQPDSHSATRVTITCRNVPPGIRPEDHDAGLRSTLENLAAFLEVA
jgi:uncharacterized protein YndB with AHSA1/START domain